LGSADIGFVLVVNPVLIKPVIDGCCEINMVSEVSWPGACGEELGFLWHQVGAIHFHIGSLVVLGD